ncbi:MAG TPA: hypothetical protein VF669_15510 [Tepidisphaeraceae bacterium]|jgi:uncharacterized delta-60 repeat protein
MNRKGSIFFDDPAALAVQSARSRHLYKGNMNNRTLPLLEPLERRALLAAVTMDVMLANDGQAPSPFGSDVKIASLQRDGKYRLLLSYKDPNTSGTFVGFRRLRENGTLDRSFGSKGKLLHHFLEDVEDVILQPDGKALAIMTTFNAGFQVARLNPDATLDTTYGKEGIAKVFVSGPSVSTEMLYYGSSALAQDMSLIVVERGKNGLHVRRVLPNGDLDESFGTKSVTRFGDEAAGSGYTPIAIDQQDRILIGGDTGTGGFITRLLPNGKVDGSFGDKGTATVADRFLTSVAVASDGKIYTGGGLARRVWRLNNMGSVDSSFAAQDLKTSQSGIRVIHPLSRGKVMVMLNFSELVLLNLDGTQDMTFNNTGSRSFSPEEGGGRDFFIDGNGRINLFGGSTAVARTGQRPAIGVNPAGTLYVTTKDAADSVILEARMTS